MRERRKTVCSRTIFVFSRSNVALVTRANWSFKVFAIREKCLCNLIYYREGYLHSTRSATCTFFPARQDVGNCVGNQVANVPRVFSIAGTRALVRVYFSRFHAEIHREGEKKNSIPIRSVLHGRLIRYMAMVPRSFGMDRNTYCYSQVCRHAKNAAYGCPLNVPKKNNNDSPRVIV